MPNDESTEIKRFNSLPRHVAIIMDGNGRWAQKRFMPRVAGHKAGVDAVRAVVETCAQKGIEALTLFAFSTENWKRPEQEVSWLMQLFMTALQREVKKLHENGIRLRVIGELDAFPAKLQTRIREAQELTCDNTGLQLNIAANYGGRWDITQSVRGLAEQVARGELSADDIDEEAISANLSLAHMPEPDLFIRTGGEQRISNFLLWQLAYTELYFTEILWPDFTHAAFEEALISYASRQRRFGRTGEQVEELKKCLENG